MQSYSFSRDNGAGLLAVYPIPYPRLKHAEAIASIDIGHKETVAVV
jgi:hypothetical protein